MPPSPQPTPLPSTTAPPTSRSAGRSTPKPGQRITRGKDPRWQARFIRQDNGWRLVEAGGTPILVSTGDDPEVAAVEAAAVELKVIRTLLERAEITKAKVHCHCHAGQIDLRVTAKVPDGGKRSAPAPDEPPVAVDERDRERIRAAVRSLAEELLAGWGTECATARRAAERLAGPATDRDLAALERRYTSR